MEQRFSHTAEEDGLHGRWHGIHHMAEVLQTQVADGLIKPGVAEAHLAVEVTFGGGFYVEFSQHGNPP
jgi:hypothetical protein